MPGMNLKFTIIEGITHTETLYFMVTQQPLVNLRRRIVTYKGFLPVHQEVQDLGSFDPSAEAYSVTFPTQTVPTGWKVRGSYAQTINYLDESVGSCCPEMTATFAIVKA
eukprot:NODE_6783_length_537_cov_2.196721_g6358_i0.p1 GENE.NODE_6783_length_537_cov_2.196721_g6358_i0~~NODE_6783_length_537_cov_2.196721_g6358_i0.p1  ORF type:complete len:125 (-),score=15.00 NODE_6783_length_537_cov_2.196721_g6358_i0:161-487(-)